MLIDVAVIKAKGRKAPRLEVSSFSPLLFVFPSSSSSSLLPSVRWLLGRPLCRRRRQLCCKTTKLMYVLCSYVTPFWVGSVLTVDLEYPETRRNRRLESSLRVANDQSDDIVRRHEHLFAQVASRIVCCLPSQRVCCTNQTQQHYLLVIINSIVINILQRNTILSADIVVSFVVGGGVRGGATSGCTGGRERGDG